MIREKITARLVQQLYRSVDKTFTSGGSSQGELTFDNRDLALYIHFPFCNAICRYCPFSRTADSADMERYLNSLKKEFSQLKNSGTLNNSSITSLSFGGGTPSLIPEKHLREIMALLKECFPELDMIQKTMECTPQSISSEKLALFEELGFNRLTIGIQSFQQEVLSELGRKETPEMIRERLKLVQKSWHGVWSCDLIYGFKSHDKDLFLRDIEELVNSGCDHLSLFPLINSDSKNRQSLPATQFRRMEEMYYSALKLLTNSGFSAYSVEDFSRNEKSHCDYQKDVWAYPQKDLLILGSGAFGISGNVQYRKENNRKRYMEAVENGEFPTDRYLPISPKRAEKIRPLLGLHYNSVKSNRVPLYFILKATGAVLRTGDTYTLTQRGRFITSLLWAKIMLHRMSN